MLSNSFIRILESDLQKLKKEISLYRHESHIWVIDGDIRNSAGNLCLHITGSLDYFIGSVLGQAPVIRKRDEEFSVKNISRNILIAKTEATLDTVQQQLQRLNDPDYAGIYPVPFGNNQETIAQVITYLISHVAYHVGQVSYHRRLIEQS